MDLTPAALANVVSWIATGLGAGLWLWGQLREQNPIQRQRMQDCAVVLVFSAILVRVMVQDHALTPIDWAFAFLSPLFIAAALWRLARTACPTNTQ